MKANTTILQAEARLEEHMLIQNAKSDPSSFKKIYENYYPLIFRFVYHKTSDKDLTADIVSQVFVQALVNLQKYKDQGLPFSAWLYRIAVNEISMFFRNQSHNRYVTLDDSFLENLASDELEMMDKELILNRVEGIIQELSNEEINILELRYQENKTHKEIAFILSISETNVTTKTSRILDKIRKAYAKKI